MQINCFVNFVEAVLSDLNRMCDRFPFFDYLKFYAGFIVNIANIERECRIEEIQFCAGLQLRIIVIPIVSELST